MDHEHDGLHTGHELGPSTEYTATLIIRRTAYRSSHSSIFFIPICVSFSQSTTKFAAAEFHVPCMMCASTPCTGLLHSVDSTPITRTSNVRLPRLSLLDAHKEYGARRAVDKQTKGMSVCGKLDSCSLLCLCQASQQRRHYCSALSRSLGRANNNLFEHPHILFTSLL
jgi:hypothetical protein